MRIAFLAAALTLTCALPTAADILIAERTIRPGEIVGPMDVGLATGDATSGLAHPSDVIGMEARAVLYAGRPIRREDVGAPAIVTRNAPISLIYASGPISISTEGRAMERGGVGETIRVMNLSSRTTVTGRISEDGRIFVTSVTP